ncbi:MAG: endonuclease III domain-containing protein [Aggregatilineales bacterium]
MLSAKTPPARYKKAFADLKRAYPHYNDLALANVAELGSIIRYAGLSDKKSLQINRIAKRLKDKFGRVTLQPLNKMSDEEAEEFLLSLPGIGIKSARCILMYSLDRKVFPADNHCLRIAQRLGWIPKATFTKGSANTLQDGIQPLLRRTLHVGMVLLGRSYCFPKNPKCESCPILEYCPTGRQIAITKVKA